MKKACVMILSMMMVAILTVTNLSGAYQAACVVYAVEDGNAGSEEDQEDTPDAGGAASEETPDHGGTTPEETPKNTEVQRESPEKIMVRLLANNTEHASQEVQESAYGLVFRCGELQLREAVANT